MTLALALLDPDAPVSALGRPGLHEIYAGTLLDTVSALGLALGLVRGRGAGKPWLWVWHEALDHAFGRPFPPGLAEWGLVPSSLVLVRVQSVREALQAGLDAARCAGLGAVVISLSGEARSYDLVATRRLAMAARARRNCVFIVRAGAAPVPSAAETRWRAGASPSSVLAAQAPGMPALRLELLRHRGGCAPGFIVMEWNRDAGCFRGRARAGCTAGTPSGAPLSGALVPMVLGRTDHPQAPERGGGRIGGCPAAGAGEGPVWRVAAGGARSGGLSAWPAHRHES
ncbi:MAG TPA: hypothetical protein PLQ11_08815, partial [Beijerinckiaceae bacterium]|nr:hypothetical protein [Beijerinckiaceae bacterium]